MSNEISHPSIQNGWFMEVSDTMWAGQANALKVEKILHHEKSKYQDVLVFKSSNHGNVLVLDNAVQCTEFDEFAYHEMITHLPMNLHPNPKKVLVIGGGDGGVLREVLKHKSVEEAWLCDIDEAVVRLSKQYLPDISVAYNDPKVKVHIGDGFEFLKQYKNTFDVIITDSSDPEGPAEGLFKRGYYELLHQALTENGVIASQSECVWLHMNVIKELNELCSDLFPSVGYASSMVPTYPSGNIGYMVATKNKDVNVRKPVREFTDAEEKKLRYYNKSVHEASFALPSFARDALRKE